MKPTFPDEPRRVGTTDSELLETVKRVVRENHVGVMTTIGADGVPHARWMLTAIGDDGLSRLYSMTGRWSRKLRDIEANPNICWVFTSANHGDVVTITGKATVLPNMTAMGDKRVAWVPLMAATRSYAMIPVRDSEGTSYVALETAAEHIELISPRLGVYTPWVVPVKALGGQAGTEFDI